MHKMIELIKTASICICTLYISQIYNPVEGKIAAKHIKQQAITITYHMDAWTKISHYNCKCILVFFSAMWTSLVL